MRDQLQTIDLPTVGVNVPAESGYFDASISIDNSSAMTMAVQLLRSLGHTNIAFCSDYIPADMVYNTSQRTQRSRMPHRPTPPMKSHSACSQPTRTMRR